MGFDLEMFLKTLVKQGFFIDEKHVDLILDRQDFRLLIPALVKMHKVLKKEMGLNDFHSNIIRKRVQDALIDERLGEYSSKEI